MLPYGRGWDPKWRESAIHGVIILTKNGGHTSRKIYKMDLECRLNKYEELKAFFESNMWPSVVLKWSTAVNAIGSSLFYILPVFYVAVPGHLHPSRAEVELLCFVNFADDQYVFFRTTVRISSKLLSSFDDTYTVILFEYRTNGQLQSRCEGQICVSARQAIKTVLIAPKQSWMRGYSNQ